MQVDGTRADGAAAGQRNLGLAAAGEQRAEHPEAGPHAADHFIGRHRIDDVARREVERLADVLGGPGTLAVDREVDAVIAQDAGEQIDVGEIGDVLQRQPVRGQQAGNHQGQGGVLGAGDRNCTVEPLAAGDLDAIHAGVPLRRRSPAMYPQMIKRFPKAAASVALDPRLEMCPTRCALPGKFDCVNSHVQF